MALDANTVWEVRADGDDNNGGGFVTGASGTDYSQQSSAQATLTTSSTVHSTTTQINVDAGDYTVAANDVGNIVQIHGGTATAGPYEITAVDTGNNRWTLDRSAGTSGQTVQANMGGGLASLGGLGALIAADTFNDKIVGGVYVRSGAYTITTSSVNASGGPFDVTHRKSFWVEGYDAASGRGSYTDRPVITVQAGVTSINVLNVAQDRRNELKNIVNLKIDGNSQSSVIGVTNDQGNGNQMYVRCWLCEVVNCPTYGFNAVTALQSIAGSNGDGFNACRTRMCIGRDNSSHGFDSSSLGNGFAEFCLAHDNGGSGFNLGRVTPAHGCIAEGNTGDGFKNADSSANQMFTDCVSVNNGGYGFNFGTTSRNVISIRNAAYNNTSGAKSHTPDGEVDFITLTADPFVDAANDDYNLNADAGGGQTLRDESVTL